MKTSVRSAWFVFVLAALIASSASAINREEAIKQGSSFLLNAALKSQSFQKPVQSRLRSSAAFKLRLDSMVVQLDSDSGLMMSPMKGILQYNAYGQVIVKETCDEKDVNGNWMVNEKTVTAYDAYGFKTSDSTYKVDYETNRLSLYEVLEYQFAPSGLMLMESSKYNLGEQYPLMGRFKKEYQYDAKDSMILQLSYTMNVPGIWMLDRKKERSFDATGKLTAEIEYDWDEANITWIGRLRFDHAYDALSRDTLVLGFNFNALKNSWLLSSRDHNQYDAAGHLLLYTNYNWNDQLQCWLENAKAEYAYDTYGNKTLEATYDMDSDSLKWEPDSREENLFDEKGNQLSQTFYSFYMGNQAWFLTMKMDYQYDFNIRSEEALWSNFITDQPVYNLITGAKFSICMSETDTTMEYADIKLYYSTMDVLGVETNRKIAPLWYYNPTSKVVTFETSFKPSNLQLFDLQGRLVFARMLTSNTSLSLNELKTGMYLMLLNVDGTVQRGKLVVEY